MATTVPFQEMDPSDDDCVSTRTMTESSNDEGFPIEAVLAERFVTVEGGEQLLYYLIKWAGWPLQASTWEPATCLAEDAEASITWAEEKRRVEAGLSKPYDVDAHHVAYEKYMTERQDRKARKAKKREKLGLSPRPRPRRAVASDGDDSNAEDGLFVDDREVDAEQPKKRVKLSTAPPNKKGVARAKPKAVKQQASSESDAAESSDDVPLADARAQRRSATRTPSTTTTPRDGSAELINRPNPKTTKQAAQDAPKARGRPKLSGSSKPPQAKGPSAATSNVFANWTAEKVPKTRRKQSTTDPREMRFASLSEQHRFQKSGAIEKPPDPSMLKTIDLSRPAPRALMVATTPQATSAATPVSTAPMQGTSTQRRTSMPVIQTSFAATTGNPASAGPATAPLNGVNSFASATANTAVLPNRRPSAPGKPAVNNTTPASAIPEIPAVFGRRSPPRAERTRSVTPPEPEDKAAAIVLRDNFKTHTCRDWKSTGKCPHGSKCYFAHYDVPNSAPERSMSASAQAHAKSLPPDPSKYRTRLCKRFAAGFCEYGDDCHFRHDFPADQMRRASESKDVIVPDAANTVPNHWDRKRIECLYWRRGKCNRSEGTCDYAHEKTGFYLQYLGDKEVRVDVSEAPVTEAMDIDATQGGFPAQLFAQDVQQIQPTTFRQQQPPPPETAAPLPPPPPMPPLSFPSSIPPHYSDGKNIECYYWRGPGECNYVESTCRYAHHRTGWYTEYAGSRQVLRDLNTVVTGGGDGPVRGSGANRTPGASTPNQQLAGDFRAAISQSNPGQSNTEDMYGFTNPINLTIRSGEKTTSVPVMLASTSRDDYECVRRILGRRGELSVSSMISAAHFQAHFADYLKRTANQQCPAGAIVMGPECKETALKLAQACALHAAAGIITTSAFTMLLFSSASDDWHFVTKPQGTSHAPLSYKLLPPLPDPINEDIDHVAPELAIRPELHNYLAVSKELLNLNIGVLRKAAGGNIRRVFIMMPPTRQEENDVLSKLFSSPLRDKDVPKVFTLLDGDDCWSNFVHKYFELGRVDAICLLLIHPEIPLETIPHLGTVVANTTTPVHWIGAQISAHEDDDAPETYQSQLIFPHGDLLLLTDETFTYDPFSTTQILKQATLINSGKVAIHADYTTAIHIAVSPTIRETLLNLASEGMGGNPLHVELWKAFTAFADQAPPTPEPSQTHLIEASDLHSYASLPLPARSSHLVAWFGHYASWHARAHRRFNICGIESKDVEGRAKEWQEGNMHCVVYTAGEFLMKLNRMREAGKEAVAKEEGRGK